MWWFQRGLCALPAGLVVWSSVTFIFSYVTAVLLGHVDPLVPYISDTSAAFPERSVFGLMLSISSFLGIATVYVRYKQVQALALGGDLKLHRLNRAGLVLGIISSVGMCVVANFQKTTIMSVHLLGAGLTFGCGVLYILFEIGVSYYMQPRFHGRDILWARTAVGLWTVFSVIIVLSKHLYRQLFCMTTYQAWMLTGNCTGDQQTRATQHIWSVPWLSGLWLSPLSVSSSLISETFRKSSCV